MRSPLSQFQTPTTPRRVVGFFRFGVPAGCPTGLITQSTSDWLILFEPTLSIVDGAKVKRLAVGCQCRFSVQTPNVVPHFYDWRNLFRLRTLLYVKISTTGFYTELSTMICSDVAWKQGAQRLRQEPWV